MLSYRGREAIQENISEGVPFLSQSCQMGYMLGCETLAKLQLLQKLPLEKISLNQFNY